MNDGPGSCDVLRTHSRNVVVGQLESKIIRSSNVSIRDLLLVIALTAVTFAAVRMGVFVGSAVSFLFLVLFMLRALVAVIAVGEERIIAIGYIVPVAIYALTLWAIGESEFAFVGNYLMTSMALSQMFYSIAGDTSDLYWQAHCMAAGHGLASLYLGFAGAEFSRAVLYSSTRTTLTSTNQPTDELRDR
jgi:hypothetical protein